MTPTPTTAGTSAPLPFPERLKPKTDEDIDPSKEDWSSDTWYPCDSKNITYQNLVDNIGTGVDDLLKAFIPAQFGKTDNALMDTIIAGLGSVIRPLANYVIDTLGNIMDVVADDAKYSEPAVQQARLHQNALQVFQHFLGLSFTEIQHRNQYVINEQIPHILPSPGEALSSYLANVIDYDQFMCLARAGGGYPGHIKNLVEASQTRLSPGEIQSLLDRELIDKDTFNQKFRELGYTDDNIVTLLDKLDTTIPSHNEAISWAGQNLDNSEVIDTFGLDEGLENLEQGTLADWIRWADLADEYKTYLWRAHWTLPSIQDGFSYYHRNRKLEDGSDNPDAADKLSQILLMNNVPPKWADDLTDLSYNLPPNLILRFGYSQGSVTEDVLKGLLARQGYKDEDIDTLVKVFNIRRLDTLYKDPLIRSAAIGEAPKEDVKAVFDERGLDPDVFEEAYRYAVILNTGALRKQTRDAYRKGVQNGTIKVEDFQQYMEELEYDPLLISSEIALANAEKTITAKQPTPKELVDDLHFGILSESEFRNKLAELNYSQEKIDYIILHQYKLPSLADSLKWVDKGLIPSSYVYNLLIEEGYSSGDANAVLTEHVLELRQKMQAEYLKQQQAIQKAEEAAQKAAQIAAAKAAAAAAKASLTAEREAKAEATLQAKEAAQASRAAANLLRQKQAKARREASYVKMIASLATDLSKKTGEPSDQAGSEIEGLVTELASLGTFTYEEIFVILSVGLSKWTTKTSPTFQDWIYPLASQSGTFVDLVNALEGEFESPAG